MTIGRFFRKIFPSVSLSNKIIIIDKQGRTHRKFFVRGLKVKFKGTNSIIQIHKPYHFGNSRITLGYNAAVFLGKNGQFRHFKLTNSYGNADSTVRIGDNFFCNGRGLGARQKWRYHYWQ